MNMLRAVSIIHNHLFVCVLIYGEARSSCSEAGDGKNVGNNEIENECNVLMVLSIQFE